MAINNLIGDYSINGSLDTKGSLKVLENIEALNQSIKLWLISKQGDMVGFPSKGGWLYKLLLKPMSETRKEDFISNFVQGLNQDFFPYVVLHSISVEPNLEKRYWEIKAEIEIPEFKYFLEFNEKVRSQE